LKYVKITLLSILVIITSVMFVACSNSSKFVTGGSVSELKQNIEAFINRGDVTGVKVNIKSTFEVDNTKIVSFMTPDYELGYCILNKYGDKYKIISTTLNTGIVAVPVVKTNKGKYLFAIGGQYDKDIYSVKAELVGESYTFFITKPYFIQMQELPKEPDNSSVASFTVYDKDNNDVTRDINLISP